MKKYIFVFLVFCFSTAQSSIIIDPTSGISSSFSWGDGLGQIDGIDGTPNTDWSINAAVDSTMSLATAIDAFVVGDEFEFVLDGSVIAWSNTFNDMSGYFHGEMTDLFLSAGNHTITLNVTALAPGFTDGAADAMFSGLTAVTAVPEPTSLALLSLGLAGFGFSRKKKKI